MTSETLHASCVGCDGAAVLLSGASGRGKSDLALRLIDRGATLVSDDYTVVRQEAGRLLASAPDRIAGRLEVRGLGLLSFPYASDLPVSLFVDLDSDPERLPEERERQIAGIAIPEVALDPREPSAPLKVELALAHLGWRR